MLAALVLVGAARLGVALVDDYLPGQPESAVTIDPVTVRRSLQLVTVSLEALAVCVGVACTRPAGTATMQVRGGGFHLV